MNHVENIGTATLATSILARAEVAGVLRQDSGWSIAEARTDDEDYIQLCRWFRNLTISELETARDLDLGLVLIALFSEHARRQCLPGNLWADFYVLETDQEVRKTLLGTNCFPTLRLDRLIRMAVRHYNLRHAFDREVQSQHYYQTIWMQFGLSVPLIEQMCRALPELPPWKPLVELFESCPSFRQLWFPCYLRANNRLGRAAFLNELAVRDSVWVPQGHLEKLASQLDSERPTEITENGELAATLFWKPGISKPQFQVQIPSLYADCAESFLRATVVDVKSSESILLRRCHDGAFRPVGSQSLELPPASQFELRLETTDPQNPQFIKTIVHELWDEDAEFTLFRSVGRGIWRRTRSPNYQDGVLVAITTNQRAQTARGADIPVASLGIETSVYLVDTPEHARLLGFNESTTAPPSAISVMRDGPLAEPGGSVAVTIDHPGHDLGEVTFAGNTVVTRSLKLGESRAQTSSLPVRFARSRTRVNCVTSQGGSQLRHSATACLVQGWIWKTDNGRWEVPTDPVNLRDLHERPAYIALPFADDSDQTPIEVFAGHRKLGRHPDRGPQPIDNALGFGEGLWCQRSATGPRTLLARIVDYGFVSNEPHNLFFRADGTVTEGHAEIADRASSRHSGQRKWQTGWWQELDTMVHAGSWIRWFRLPVLMPDAVLDMRRLVVNDLRQGKFYDEWLEPNPVRTVITPPFGSNTRTLRLESPRLQERWRHALRELLSGVDPAAIADGIAQLARDSDSKLDLAEEIAPWAIPRLIAHLNITVDVAKKHVLNSGFPTVPFPVAAEIKSFVGTLQFPVTETIPSFFANQNHRKVYVLQLLST